MKKEIRSEPIILSCVVSLKCYGQLDSPQEPAVGISMELEKVAHGERTVQGQNAAFTRVA